MFRNMSASLVKHELIRTTLPKAKELRGFIEPLITRAKVDSVANRRVAFAATGSASRSCSGSSDHATAPGPAGTCGS